MKRSKTFGRVRGKDASYDDGSARMVQEGFKRSDSLGGEGASQTGVRAGAGDDRVRDFGGRFSGNRHSCDNSVPPQTRRTLERHRKWNQQLVENGFLTRGKFATAHFRRALKGLADDQRGQSTVEYALVFAAGLAIVVAVGALSHVVGDGTFVEHAVTAASHNLGGVLGGAADVFSY